MRKIPAALAVLGLSAAFLVGCSATGGAAACDGPDLADPAVTDLISVTGSVDDAPEVSVYTPFRTDRTVVDELVAGTGAVITDPAQAVVLDITLAAGLTGETLVRTPYDGDLTRAFGLSRWAETFPVLPEALACASEGSRLVVALAPSDIAPAAAQSLGLAENESAIAVVDVRKVHLARADGADQYNAGHGLPAVVRAPDGTPGVIIPSRAAPEEIVVETLKSGDGDVVTGDVPVRVHYTGLTWDERAVFDSSWGGEPVSLSLDGVVPGFASALEGQTVGSQVLAVIPPELGYGDVDRPSIPAGSTLVFVIDILGLDGPSAP